MSSDVCVFGGGLKLDFEISGSALNFRIKVNYT